MNDLLIYLDNLIGIRSKEPQFQLAAGDAGRAEFQTLQCDSCHQGKHSLANRADPISMAEVQAMMWNHVLTTLKTRSAVNYDEMAGLVGYLWSLEPRGDPHRGELAFAKKGCGACHTDSGKGAPILNEHDLSPVSLISGVSSHGPAMRAEMKKKSLAWPRIGRAEIADMAAYLRSRHAAAPVAQALLPAASRLIGTLPARAPKSVPRSRDAAD
jgi:mono/diheme cytochrome c family protein